MGKKDLVNKVADMIDNELEKNRLLLAEVESWKPIKFNGVDTNYNVSNFGNVMNRNTGTILKASLNQQGYLQTILTIFGGTFCKRMHRLVAEAFIENDDPKNKNQVNHIDGNKLNNYAWNLEWVSCKENMEHAWKNGLYGRGSDCKSSKYKDDQINALCKLLENAENTYQSIEKQTGVKLDMIFRIAAGKNWKHISSNYKIVPRNVSRSREYMKGQFGENANNSKYTNDQIHEVCKLLEKRKVTVDMIGKTTGVKPSLVSAIKNKRCWNHISDTYNISINKTSSDVSDQNEVPKLVESSTTIERIV